VLAFAGLTRLNFAIHPDGTLQGQDVPPGMLAAILDLDVMLPCVGQGAIGIEIRANDERIQNLCQALNHMETFQCVTAERAFLQTMGGGCLSPVAAYGEVQGGKISLRAVSFQNGTEKRHAGERPVSEAAQLGMEVAKHLK
jgi:hydroxymethylbilane synthase